MQQTRASMHSTKSPGNVLRVILQVFTCLSDSPMYMLMSSGPFTLRKLMLHSVATALATSVLPVPAATHHTWQCTQRSDCCYCQHMRLMSTSRSEMPLQPLAAATREFSNRAFQAKHAHQAKLAGMRIACTETTGSVDLNGNTAALCGLR